MRGEDADGFFGLGWVECEDHAYAHVEDVEHLAVRHVAFGFEETEDGQNFPCAFLDAETLAGPEDAGDILVETATGDMCYAVYVKVTNDVEDLFGVDLGGREEHFAERFGSVEFGVDLVQVESGIGDYLTHEGIAVGVHAGGTDAQEHIAHFDFGSVDETGFLDHAGGVTCYIVFASGVHARHLGCLASDEGTSGLTATFGHAADDSLYLCGDVMTCSDVVEEDEGFSALCEHVVDTHSHGVDADGIVFVHREGNLEFGPHAICSADENRFFDVQRCEVEHSAKGADVAHRAFALGGTYVRFDSTYYFVSGLEVHAGSFIMLSHDSYFCFLK